MGLFSELGNISKATVSAVSPEGKIGGVIDENIQLSAKDFAGIAGTVGGKEEKCLVWLLVYRGRPCFLSPRAPQGFLC